MQKKDKKNCHIDVSDMKKLHPLLLILTPIKKVHFVQKFMSVLITFVAINNEESLRRILPRNTFLRSRQWQ